MPTGELAAIGAAIIWSATSIIFTSAGKISTPVATNAFKTVLGTVLFALTLWIRSGSPLPAGVGAHDFIMLVLSGLIGLSIGDSLLFKGFVTMGTRKAMLVFSLNPVMGATGGYFFLGERLGWMAILGMAVALAGVTMVIGEKRKAVAPDGLTPPAVIGRNRRAFVPSPARRALVIGALCALGAGLGQSAGAIIAKSSLERVDTLTATYIRMAAGAFGLVVLGLVTGKLRHWTLMIVHGRLLAKLTLASLFGPFIGVYLMILSIDLAPTGVALTLLSTCPIWLLPMSAWFQKDPPSRKETIGALVAIAGVALLLLR